MVSDQRMKNILSELKHLKRIGVKGRKNFFKKCSKDCVIKICECIRNVLNANVELKPSHLNKLSRHKQTLRALALKRTSLVKRKKLLQKGGFLAALLPAIIPAVASLLGGIFNRGT
jgi:hypothetical protein